MLQNSGFHLSGILTLKARRESPHGDEAERIAADFARRYNVLSPNFADFTTMSRFAYPDASSPQRLAAAGIVHNLFFFVDDVFFDRVLNYQDYGIPDTAMLQPEPFLKELMKIFLGGPLPPEPIDLHHAFAEIGRQVMNFTSREWMVLFAGAIKDYLDAATDHHHLGLIDNLETFMDHRDQDTGGLQTCMLLEVTNDVVLPDDVRNHPVLAEMTWLTYRSAAWVNDIISYHKDVYLENSQFNLVYVIEQSAGFDEAVRESIRLVNAQIERFLHLEGQLVSRDDVTNRLIQRYVSGLKDLMSGNTYWHLTTPRYRHPESPFLELRDAYQDDVAA